MTTGRQPVWHIERAIAQTVAWAKVYEETLMNPAAQFIAQRFLKKEYWGNRWMTEQEYRDKVHAIREKIEQGDETALVQAADELKAMANLRPWRLCYIYARVALMLRQGESPRLCRAILDNIDQEFQAHEELPDRFRLRERTYESGTLGARQSAFSVAAYAGKDVAQAYFVPLVERKKAFLQGTQKPAKIRELAEACYVVRDVVFYIVLMLLWCKREGQPVDCIEPDALDGSLDAVKNSGYLLQMLTADEQQTFILTDSRNTENLEQEVLAEAIRQLGHKVIRITKLNGMLPKEKVSTREAVCDWCIAHETERKGIRYVPYLLFQQNGQERFIDNRAELAVSLAKLEQEQREGVVFVFADDETMDELHADTTVAKYLQRMTDCKPEKLGYVMAFGWVGSYLDYISGIYGFSARERVERPAECEISVVLPVRNNAETLRYTLQTCLNQRFQGSYEIVLSDNSDPDNFEVYNLYSELNDSRIRYYRPPHVLELAKSFEYAYLQARGEFRFALGADDAIFPWTLQVLHDVQFFMKDYDILSWGSGGYVWPEFFDKGRRNALNIPLYDRSQKRRLIPWHQERITYKDFLREEEMHIYERPQLYMTSGFRREYFQKLLDKTGRMWDACCQDTAMGIVTFAIAKVLHISMPLALIGTSSYSIGAAAIIVKDDLQRFGQEILRQSDNANGGAYIRRRLECAYPFVGENLATVFWEMLRLVDMGCFPMQRMEPFDWQVIYKAMRERLALADILYDKRRRELSYAAGLVGQTELNETWQSEQLAAIEQPSMPDAQSEAGPRRTYGTGVSLAGRCMVLDGSQFGIRNICEAVGVVERILGL